jgi:CelD/BcsL family acetyltransferase involved in cellulose biosynthesis/RimJ/RimL family protein N-acetyltransferase
MQIARGVGGSINISNQEGPCFVLSPLGLTLTRDAPTCADSRRITPLESIANSLSPLKLTLTGSLHTCPNLQQIRPLESGANLLSPLKRTLTKNVPVSPLESTLTKCKDLKSHRIILLQKMVGEGTTRHSSARKAVIVVPDSLWLRNFQPLLYSSSSYNAAAFNSCALNPRSPMTLSLSQGKEAHETIGSPGFQSHWARLHEACPWTTAFQSPGYITAWHEAYKDRYSPLVVSEFSAAGDLIGLISLATENGSGRLIVAGGHQAEYKAWLALPANGDSFIEAALKLLASETRAGVLSFGYLPPGTPTDWIVRSRGTSWICDLKPHPRPIIPLSVEGDVAAYVQKKKSGKSTRNSWNRLKRIGNLHLEQLREAGQLAPVFDELIAYYDTRQGGTHGKFAFQTDLAKKPFHLALLNVPDLLHVTLLKAGEEIISASFGLTYRKTYSWAMPMFSPFCGADSPTKVHLLMLVEQLHQDGYSVFDLTAGADPFKDRFAASYDSVHSLSLYFSRGKWIKHTIVQGGEALARRALRSLRIAPNSAVEHVKQVARVPLGTWPAVLAQGSVALLKRSLSKPQWRIYVLEPKNVPAIEDAPLMSRDRLADLLPFQPAEFWRTRQGFLAESLKNIESGHHFYTRVENGRLLHLTWLVENQKTKVFPETDQAFDFPPGSVVVYGSYTDPGSRGRGLCLSALCQILHDVAKIPEVNYIFTAVPADNKPARHVVEKVGFTYRGVDAVLR